jgi:hypothetical protein
VRGVARSAAACCITGPAPAVARAVLGPTDRELRGHPISAPGYRQASTDISTCTTGRMVRAWTAPFALTLLGVAKAAEQAAVEGMETGRYLTPRIQTTSTTGIAGHTTFTVSVTAARRPAGQDRATTIYAIFGDQHGATHLRLPPAFHVATPFGVDIGGTNPAFWTVSPDAQYDSWLTVGVTRGNVHNSISSIGISWAVRPLVTPSLVRPCCAVRVPTCTHPHTMGLAAGLDSEHGAGRR